MVDVGTPVAPARVAAELTDRTVIARFKDLEVHLVCAHEARATMDEIGRIREIEFRAAGAGRNVARDIDSFDTDFPWYVQLVSWDPAERQIVALYRAIRCSWALRHAGLQALRTSGLFQFSDEFIRDYLSRSVELGRSVVNRTARRALQGLFSIWTGLGAMTREWPDVDYFFGNVSLYRSLPQHAVAAIVDYLRRYHSANPGLVTARYPALPATAELPKEGLSQAAALERLLATAGREGWSFPPILLSYLKAHSGLMWFDAAMDRDFGGAIEVAIAVPTRGVSPRTVKRFVDPYTSMNPRRFILPERP